MLAPDHLVKSAAALLAALDGMLQSAEVADAADGLEASLVAVGAREADDQVVAERAAALSDPSVSRLGPFVRDSETSRLAALAAYPKQGTQRWSIIMLLDERERGGGPILDRPSVGFNRDELAKFLGLSPNTIRPRVRELIVGGWIEESGATRPSTAGHDSAVLVLTEKARREVKVRPRT